MPIGSGRLVGDMRFITDFNGRFDGASARRRALSITIGYEWTLARRPRAQQQQQLNEYWLEYDEGMEYD